jgi:hypothetical protein
VQRLDVTYAHVSRERGTRVEIAIEQRYATSQELEELLAAAGLRLRAYWGDFSGQPFGAALGVADDDGFQLRPGSAGSPLARPRCQRQAPRVIGKRALLATPRRVALYTSPLLRVAVACAALMGCAALLACGSDPDPDDSAAGTCPSDLPTDADCAAGVAPQYGAVIAGIVEQRCEGCHFPQNPFSSQVFGDYAQLFAARRTALSRVYSCLMPPADAPQLRPEERGALLKWFVCGAPQN